MASYTKQLEMESQEYQKLQKEFQQTIDSRTKLEAQLRENEAVQREFDRLEDDACVYKLIGPVLVKQERIEATSNVDKRIDFIRREIERVETQIKALSSKQDAKKEQVCFLICFL
ncbi:Prefoldin subunit 6, variant 2 [Entomophthora muscae]|uniref:Prefoldin subunit 6, variant 2 n=1 Tax=Entomophthora muscae TaxID=34485 RepID=A0ACC2RY36_9FUNG|nr:Prefoldin subunit 6, variant 2 [Entomophthora muscae]